MRKPGLVFVFGLVVPLFTGCFMDHGAPGEEPPPPTTEPPPVVGPPAPAIDVGAAISAAYLGQACGDASRIDGDGDCGIGGCGCEASSMQLRFTSDQDYGDLPIRIVRVTMHSFESGDYIQDLVWNTPQRWDDTGGYVAWDEVFATPGDINTSWGLDAPDWESIYTTFEEPWRTPFQIRVVVEIAGEERTLTSGEIYEISTIDT